MEKVMEASEKLNQKENERAEIQKAMDAFLAKGGKVNVLPSVKNKSSKSMIRLSGDDHAFTDYSESTIEEFY